MAIDNNTWGFSKPVAEALQASIVNGETEIPERLPGGGGRSEVLFAFTVASTWLNNQTIGDIRRLSGDLIGDLVPGEILYDPVGIFQTLDVGDTGLCMLSGGKYYIIQANCPSEEEESEE